MDLNTDEHAPRMFQLSFDMFDVNPAEHVAKKNRGKFSSFRKKPTPDESMQLLLRFPDDTPDEQPSVAQATSEEIAAVKRFSEDEIILLADLLIVDALMVISRDCVNPDAYQEAYDWIMEVDPVEVVGKKAQQDVTEDGLNAALYSIPLKEAIFSFEWCCRVVQNDPEIFRDRVRKIESKRVRDFTKNLKRKLVSGPNPIH